MLDAFPHENRKNETDELNTPPHCLWVIVEGSATAALIAQAIYANRGTGANMKGNVSYTITQVDGTSWEILWDNVTTEPLYFAFTATPIDHTKPIKYAEILSGLPSIFTSSIHQTKDATSMASLVQQIDPNCLVTLAGLNTTPGPTFFNTIENTSLDKKFSLATDGIYILPIQLLPTGMIVAHGHTQKFTAYGGNQSFSYSIAVNNSGSSINSSTGVYTAGATPNVVDTIQAVDGDGNVSTVTVTVT
jgi:hypothetical protein